MISMSDLHSSPNGWKLEPMSRYMSDHEFAANRCRNIIAGLENLLAQIGVGWCSTEFIQRLQAAKEVYEFEMVYHRSQANAPELFRREE